MALALGGLYRQVPGEGPFRAEVVLLGEAGGEEEARQGRPFVGPTGKLVEELLAGVGMKRNECRIDNVIQRHPPHNRLAAIPKDERLRWFVDVRERMAQLKPRVIVTLGGLALEALTGKKSIANWRGSLLSYNGATLVPMYHPAMTFR